MPFFHVPLHFGYKKGHFIIKHSGLSLFVFSHSLLLDMMLKSDDHLPPVKKGKRSSLAVAGQSHFKVHSNWHSCLHRNGCKITIVHLTRDVSWECITVFCRYYISANVLKPANKEEKWHNTAHSPIQLFHWAFLRLENQYLSFMQLNPRVTC